MEYPIHQLGPTGFQDLAAALAVRQFGSEVYVMGRGRDGGRDMYHQGELHWESGEGPNESWGGYTVFQVKHRERPSSHPSENASWLWTEIRKELDAWAEPAKGRHPIPDALVFITNISLSAVQNSGGHDRIQSGIHNFIDELRDDSRDLDASSTQERLAKLHRLDSIQRFRFWDGNQIQALLTSMPGIRRAFPAFLTATDVFESFSGFTDRLPLQKLKPALLKHGRASLTGEGQIYFDQAGSAEASGFPVHKVVVDLPVTIPDEAQRKSAISHVIDRAEHVLKPSLTRVEGPRHLVLTGAPGNGKTTLSKFLVQAFRAAMLHGSSSLSQGQLDTIKGTQEALQRLGLDLPKNRRWAIQVDLAEYAEEGGLEDESTLLRWIAHKISRTSDGGEVSPSLLQAWQEQWPWFLVLDGLDEVTEPQTRKRLIRHVTTFVEEAEAENYDLFVALTTRPVGYTENVAPHLFQQVDLGELSGSEALHYGKMVTRVRLGSDQERFARVEARLEQAAADESLRPLLKTPLQVLILTIIVDGSGRLPPDRYNLFRTYYDTVFRRETDKLGGLRHLLQEQKTQILRLHEKVGFELQVQSEDAHKSSAMLSDSELRHIAWEVMSEDGFDPSGKHSDLLEKLLRAATERLVLIVPRGDGGYGFEVRSLQELTASFYLANGPLDVVTKRLRIAAASPHWRNVWLFAAGQFFATPQMHQQEAIIELIESLDADAAYRLGNCVPVGPRLALDVLDDGMARANPKWRTRIAAIALRTLWEPRPLDLSRIARVLLRFASAGEDQASQVAAGFRDAFEKYRHSLETTTTIQQLIPTMAKELDASMSARAISSAKPRPQAKPPAPDPDRWEIFQLELLTNVGAAEVEDKHRVRLENTVRRISEKEAENEDVIELVSALGHPEVCVVLEKALEHVIADEARLYVNLRDSVLTDVHRQAVGEQLRKFD